MKCPQCGHDTLMQQEQDGALYLCGFCGFKQYRCPKCDTPMLPDKSINLRNGAERFVWYCRGCNHTEPRYEEPVKEGQ